MKSLPIDKKGLPMTQNLNEIRDVFFNNLTEKHGSRITMYTIIGVNFLALNASAPENLKNYIAECTGVITSAVIQLADITEEEHALAFEQARIYLQLLEPHESEAS